MDCDSSTSCRPAVSVKDEEAPYGLLAGTGETEPAVVARGPPVLPFATP